MKKLICIFLTFFLFGNVFNIVLAKEKIEINFFFSPICPHCSQEKEFLVELKDKYPEIKIISYNIFEKESFLILKKFYQRYQVPLKEQGFVPITFIDEKYFLGFNQNIAKEIEECILKCRNNKIIDKTSEIRKKFSLPFIGEINVSNFSPLALAIILGTIDGFNVCAMLTLGFLLFFLIATGSRKRVLLIGGVFVLTSGIVYFIFISFWLNLFFVLGQIKLITYLIGTIIILFAIFSLKDYFQGIICKLCHIQTSKKNFLNRLQKKLFLVMEKIVNTQMPLPLILLGVVITSAGINLTELVCSLGFPLAFTKILTSFSLPTISYYFYLLVYILFYMLDDLIIFLLAVLFLRITQISERYLKAITLISSILLLILGLIIIFQPQILLFN